MPKVKFKVREVQFVILNNSVYTIPVGIKESRYKEIKPGHNFAINYPIVPKDADEVRLWIFFSDKLVFEIPPNFHPPAEEDITLTEEQGHDLLMEAIARAKIEFRKVFKD